MIAEKHIHPFKIFFYVLIGFLIGAISLSSGDAAKKGPIIQNVDTRNGNWWRSREQMEKLQYVLGFFDGMELGHRFSYWGVITTEQKPKPCMGKLSSSFAEYQSRYMSKVTAGQIADGLDEFYSDYRNRSLLIVNATWLVLNEINGTPRAEMDAMIERFRKNTKQ